MNNGIRPLKRIVIKEEYVALTGSFIAAALLGQMEYWQHRTRDIDQYIAEEKQRRSNHGLSSEMPLTNGWIYKTADELSEETMLGVSDRTIRKYLLQLIESGWLQERDNPYHQWDKTKQYRLDLLKVSADLEALGFHLEGWILEAKVLHHPSSKSSLRDDESSLQSAASSEQYQRLQPETTAETTLALDPRGKMPMRTPASQRIRDPKHCIDAFTVTEERLARAMGFGVRKDRVSFETDLWRDYYKGRGTPIVDLDAIWNGWMRRAGDRQRKEDQVKNQRQTRAFAGAQTEGNVMRFGIEYGVGNG